MPRASSATVAPIMALIVPGALPAHLTTPTAVVLQLPSGPRALAPGDAHAAAGGDEAADFDNGAALASPTGLAASLSIQDDLAFPRPFAGTLAVPVGSGAMGVGRRFGATDNVGFRWWR